MPGSNVHQPPAKHVPDYGNRRPAPLPKPQPKPTRPGKSKRSDKPFGQNRRR